MSLTKIINDGDELVFDLSHIASHATRRISIVMVRRARPANIMVIRADPSIPIRHMKLTKFEEADMAEGCTLPVYRCHKMVQAAKITKIDLHNQDDSIVKCATATLHFGLIGQSVTVDDSWLANHNPEEGGWFVVYDDGYQSYSPAKAFETGYLPA